MKSTIKKSITVITMLAVILTLAMPVNAEAAAKKSPKLSKSKITLTISKKKTKPAYKLKVKNTAGKRVKWTSTNKKVVTVSKTGKVVAKKKGTAVVKVTVGKKALRCKVVVKDNRAVKKPNATKTEDKNPVPNPTPNPTPTPEPNPVPGECEHNWVAVTKTVYKVACGCGMLFNNIEEHNTHAFEKTCSGEINGHSNSPHEETVVTGYKCSKCGAAK